MTVDIVQRHDHNLALGRINEASQRPQIRVAGVRLTVEDAGRLLNHLAEAIALVTTRDS